MTMSPDSASAIIAGLADRFAATLGRVVPDGPVALVDFPDHANVGDSAIWLGETCWLRVAGRTPSYVSALADFDAAALADAVPDGPILIHGGGNFGTLWPKHEMFRLELLRAFPGRPIIQLPQSIHYADDATAGEMAETIRTHGAFTLLVRDARSLTFAREHFDCAVELCPDAALMLGRQARSRAANTDVLALLRTDHERRADQAQPHGAGVVAVDWLTERRASRWTMRQRLRLAKLRRRTRQAERLARFEALARWRVARGLRLLARGRVVVTDRLHAHILSLLLDLPHVVLDNSYGKIGGFADQWTAGYRGLRRAETLDEALEAARELLDRFP